MKKEDFEWALRQKLKKFPLETRKDEIARTSFLGTAKLLKILTSLGEVSRGDPWQWVLESNKVAHLQAIK